MAATLASRSGRQGILGTYAKPDRSSGNKKEEERENAKRKERET